MKRFVKLLTLVAALAVPTIAHAQQAVSNGSTTVQETQTDPRAGVFVAVGSGSAQQTLTLTCPSGTFPYLVSYTEVDTATTAPVASVLTTTTTSFNGLKFFSFFAAAIGSNTNPPAFYPAKPLKGTANVATIVTQAAISNITYDPVATWYCAL